MLRSIPSTSTRPSRSRALLPARAVGAAGADPRHAGRKADRKTNRELTSSTTGWRKAADELGDNEKALNYYKPAYDLDSTYLPTLLGRAALLYKMEDWDGAFRIYQTILVHHRDAQKDDEIVDIFYRLGNIKLKLGERKKALNMFEKALEIEPATAPTLQAVIDLYTAPATGRR